MDDEYISRKEHDEFCKRIDAEDERQNKRIALLEDSIKQIGVLTTSVEKLALNMENMVKEQARQGERLEVLEGRDGEMWRKVVGYAVTAVVGIIVGYLFTHFGM